MKTFAIGDLHGRFDLLTKTVEFLEKNFNEGKLIILGDMIDRGPQSSQINDYLIAGPTNPNWEWVVLLGNHEVMALAAHGPKGTDEVWRWWRGHGGKETLESYEGNMRISDEHLVWMANLPHIHFDQHRVFVHAGLEYDVPLDEQIEDVMLWVRRPVGDQRDHMGKHIVHGHDQRKTPLCLRGRTNIDVHAYKTGRIAIAEFDDGVEGGPVRFHMIETG